MIIIIAGKIAILTAAFCISREDPLLLRRDGLVLRSVGVLKGRAFKSRPNHSFILAAPKWITYARYKLSLSLSPRPQKFHAALEANYLGLSKNSGGLLVKRGRLRAEASTKV